MGLQIERDQSFQRRDWQVTRLGLVLIASVVVAALLGLLGPGPLSWATATGGAGVVAVDYQRFTHVEADDSITIRLGQGAVQSGAVEILLGSEWVESVTITGITPQPSDATLTPEGLRLTLPLEGGTDVPVQVYFRPGDIGSADGLVAAGGERATFNQFVYP